MGTHGKLDTTSASLRHWGRFLRITILAFLVLAVPSAFGSDEGFAPPTDLRGWRSGRYIELSWNAPAVGQVSGYNIYRAEASNGPWTGLNAELVAETTYVDRYPLSETAYYSVTAVNQQQIETGQATPVAVTNASSTSFDTASQVFPLSFPLQGVDAFTAFNNSVGSINSVFDHSMTLRYQNNLCPQDDTSVRCVIAFTGEIGNNNDDRRLGSDLNGGLYAYGNLTRPSFMVTGNYRGPGGDKAHLYYDGHPGYDYSTGGENLTVFAAADGVTANVGGCVGAVKLDHQEGNLMDGVQTLYLHLNTLNASVTGPTGQYATGRFVARGTPIGTAGGVECNGSVNPNNVHLHFEVRKNVNGEYVSVDPYGWEGDLIGKGSDPYRRSDIPGINIRLWGPRPVSWNPGPPASVQSGTIFTASWSLTGSSTHTNVHYDTIEDVSKNTCLGRPSSCQSTGVQSGSGSFSAQIQAPSVSVPTPLYFVAHATIDGKETYSSLALVTVVPLSGFAPGDGAPNATIRQAFINAYNADGGTAILGQAQNTVQSLTRSFYSPASTVYSQNFSGGSYGSAVIEMLAGTSTAFTVRTGFYNTYQSAESTTGQTVSSLLVAPSNNEAHTSSPSVEGKDYNWQPFLKGGLYFYISSPIDGGAFSGQNWITYVWGDIADRYGREGGRTGAMGLPLFNEIFWGLSGGWNWWYQWFEKGFVWYAKSVSTGATWSYAWSKPTDVYNTVNDWVPLGWCQHAGGGITGCIAP